MLKHFTFRTAGESHGKGMLVLIEGVPAGVPLSPLDVAADLTRRQLGFGRGGRMQIEKDAGEFLSGVRLGETIGSPVTVWVLNRDHENWRVAMSAEPQPDADDEALRRVYLPRPGHADLVGLLKFGRSDARDILERSSARETSARVAAGAVARRLLGEFGIEIGSHVVRIGDVKASEGDGTAPGLNDRADASDVRCLDAAAAARMREAISAAAKVGDTLGGVFEVVATGLPVGLGSYVTWDRRLDARIGAAMLGIQAMKGVEIGLGFRAAELRGSDVHDEIEREPARRLTGGYHRRSNSAGGLEGGITTGEPLVVRIAMKPLSSLTRPLDSVNVRTGQPAKAEQERSDVCAVPAAGVVGEAMLALVLADAMREKFGGDTLVDMRTAWESYLARVNSVDFSDA